jgi:5'-3' exonuclease
VSRGYLLIDGSNVAHASNNGTPLSIGDQPTQAIYNFLRTMRPMMSVYSMLTPVVLWDGSSWRYRAFPDYKASRNKPAVKPYEIKAKALREDLKKQLPFIREGLSLLGIRQLVALNYEADDLAGMLVKRYTGAGSRDAKIIMISGDQDWIQLVRPRVAWRDPVHDKFVSHGNIMEKEGVPSPRAHLEVKCLWGDKGDDIPGVGGIGKDGAIEFIAKYGSVAAFLNQCADKSIDIDKLPKKFRDLATSDEKQELYRRNMRLMDLTTKERPEPVNLKLTRGELDIPKFQAFCEQFLFNSMLSDINRWCEPFAPQEEAIAA